jgi:hypothetical protein
MSVKQTNKQKEDSNMKNEPINPFLVALGHDIQSQIVFSAADMIGVLHWSNENGATYHISLLDVGFDTRGEDEARRLAVERGELREVNAEMTTRQAAALMFIIANADEPETPDGDVTTDPVVAAMYVIVEAWLTANNIPNNLRPIP